jgi:ABC-type uncharacterized transport system permease subunit
MRCISIVRSSHFRILLLLLLLLFHFYVCNNFVT